LKKLFRLSKMGGSLAICNKTPNSAELVLLGLEGRTTLSRTCEPQEICAFDNIRPVEYMLQVMIDSKLVIQKKCKADGCLYTLSEQLKLECDENYRILWVKKADPLGLKFDGDTIADMSKTRQIQGFQLGWQVAQIGHLHSAEWKHLHKKSCSVIHSLISNKFDGSSVVVFKTNSSVNLNESEETEVPEKNESSNGQNSRLSLNTGFGAWARTKGKGRWGSPSKMRMPRLISPFKKSPTRRKNTDYSFTLLKEWIILHEAHKEMFEKDRTSVRNLVCKLATAFENVHKQAETNDESVKQPKKDTQNDQHAAEEQRSFAGEISCLDKKSVTEIAGVSWLVRESILDDVDITTLIRKENLRMAEARRLKNSQQSWTIVPSEEYTTSSKDKSNKDSVAQAPEMTYTEEVPPLEEASQDQEVADMDNGIQSPDTKVISTNRVFEYPFFETVRRLSDLGLELSELEPKEFLEHEVHYVQAALEAQSIIAGEPFVLDCATNRCSGWSTVYASGISKFYWIRNCDGVVSLDPPSDDFWVLLANPMEPSNPFPYPLTEEVLS